MRPVPRIRRRLMRILGLATVLGLVPLIGTVRAAAPVVTITPTGARVQVSAATLSETIDAFARAAGFKVTYDGARPSAMLFNAEVDTPTVAHTLSRLLEGQNLNYGIVFDLTGTKVTTLMIFGTAGRTAGAAGPGAAPGQNRPQSFPTPRNPRATLPPVDDDPAEEAQPEVAPEPSPTPAPTGAPPVNSTPLVTSPFGPRAPFSRPIGTRIAAPSPTPSP